MSLARKPPAEAPIQLFATPEDWETWLGRHHAGAPGLWLQLAKKGAKLQSLSYAEALDVALCYGWIDGQKKGLDDSSWLQKFTPRQPKSLWSKINREKVAALIQSGRMKPAGLEAIEKAKQDGRWDAAYDSPGNATVPDDFQAELDKSPQAQAFYDTLEKRNTYAILWRIQTAKKAETRAKRIREFVEMLERGEKVHP